MTSDQNIPIQPVEQPILCSPYLEPAEHWLYDRDEGQHKRAGFRRPAGYYHKTDKVGSAQERLFDEERDDLPLINRLREDVRRWREADYRGASHITKDLLRHWAREDLPRRLFFCQREAVETVIYLAELRIPERSSRTGFKNFELPDEDLQRLLKGEKPKFEDLTNPELYPSLIDQPFDTSLLPMTRVGCKMATGSGKTVVMAMLIAWAFCNRGTNRENPLFPSAVLVCCPNLTVKERLQVLRPEDPNNYYEAFDLVPPKYRPLLQLGKVLVTNWHAFAPESEHKEGDRTYAVVDKGKEPPEAFAKRVLGELADRLPIMVFNDEGHHCWRPAADSGTKGLTKEEKDELEEEKQEATVWVEGLDRINNIWGDGRRGISLCVDLSATPFYIQGSGHPEGRPFPWLVSDFGLIDAIESGIVKIPRLPVQDTTGRPEPRYFKLWERIREDLEPAEFLPGKARKPKPEAVWRLAQPALQQLADQWVERFKYLEEAAPGKEHVPPVLIIVCDNTDVAELLYRKISGEHEEDIITEADVEEAVAEDAGNGTPKPRRRKKGSKKTRTVYEDGALYPEYLSNRPGLQRTIRIDSKLLGEAESEDPSKNRRDAAEALRQVVATVGKPGEPGEHVRCVVSVSMLTEGWDANNVTHIMGLRAFGSQLLCEQVVGRGLRRMDYTPDPETGMLTEEYVDVYGIPFSVIPFKGRATDKAAPEDKPKNHVRALTERAELEMRFPVVEGYAFALRQNSIRCDVASMERLVLEPTQEPTATFVLPTLGYHEGVPAQRGGAFKVQNREEYYRRTHLQAIQFQITRLIVEELTSHRDTADSDAKRKVLRLQSRHQLFPQVFGYVEQYVREKVDFQGQNPCELGLDRYVNRIVERLRDGIEPDDREGEPPLLPILNRYKPIGTTADVDFKTTRPCHATNRSHINQIVADTQSWEQIVALRLEQCDLVQCFARNDHLGLVIPYEFEDIDRSYEPDFLVRLASGLTVVLEVKGFEDERTRAKHQAARRWVSAVNNWGKLGQWDFHVCRQPQTLEDDLAALVEADRKRQPAAASA